MKVLHILLLAASFSLLMFNVTHGWIDGKQAEKNSMQYMVSLQSNGVHVCGGFLIHPGYVLTAANCDLDGLSVVLGTQNIDPKKNILTRYTVQKKFVYPLYKSPHDGFDIMLLKLSEKVNLNNEHVKIINISSKHQLEPNTTCKGAGWGRTENDIIVNDLMVGDVPIIDMTICKKLWRLDNIKLPINILCAGGYKTESGACQGDSGGPLVCNDMAVGIVSFNRRKICDYPDVPNVYTDISAYANWINNVTGSYDKGVLSPSEFCLS